MTNQDGKTKVFYVSTRLFEILFLKKLKFLSFGAGHGRREILGQYIFSMVKKKGHVFGQKAEKLYVRRRLISKIEGAGASNYQKYVKGIGSSLLLLIV